MKFRTIHDAVRVRFACSGESLTKQSEKENCDINRILNKYRSTGVLPGDASSARYADVSDVPDFQSAMNTVRYATESFLALSAEVRKRFSNDPAAMIDFLSDPANAAEAAKLGLINPPSVEPESPSIDDSSPPSVSD